MPGESRQHAAIVEGLVSHIREVHEPPGGFVLYSDTGERCELPQRVNGYIPDVFASDVPSTFHIIGEAKTHGDIVSQRSKRQVKAFLDFLSAYSNSIFYLAVPVFSQPRANQLLNEITEDSYTGIDIRVLPLAIGEVRC